MTTRQWAIINPKHSLEKIWRDVLGNRQSGKSRKYKGYQKIEQHQRKTESIENESKKGISSTECPEGGDTIYTEKYPHPTGE